MNQKIILTERQHQLILNKIVEDINENINKQVLEEGLWEKTKYYLSKLGRYKANGKIFGKGKVDKEAAAKIQAIIDKKGNEAIQKIDAEIKKTNPEFPNNEKSVDFLNTIMAISSVYDSIVAATQKSPNDEGYLPIDAANGVINDLRDYVKKFLDVDLTAAYSVVDEAEGNVLELTDDELQEIDEAWGLNEAPYVEMPNRGDNEPEEKNGVSVIRPKSGQLANKNTQVSKGGNSNNQLSTTDNSNKGLAKTSNVKVSGKLTSNPRSRDISNADYKDVSPEDYNRIMNKDSSKSTRDYLAGKRGGGDDFKSTRMQTLKSNKLPMTLAGVGTSLGAFSWLANTDWFKHLFDTVSKTTDVETINQTIQNKSELIGNIKPGQGLTQLMNSMNNAGLTPNTTPEQFLEQVKILGDGDVNAGINALAAKGGIFVNPTAAKQVLSDIAQNPHGHGDNLGQIFKGKWAGTGKSIGDTLTCHDSGQVKAMITSTLTKAVPTIVTKTAIKTGAGYAIAKGFGSVLGPIGVGLLAGGALVKLMRLKGQKQSRAATLNMLYQSLRNLDGGTGIVKPETEVVSPKQAGTEAGMEGGVEGGMQGGDKSGQGGKKTQVSDDLYNSIRNLFQFIVNNKKTLGYKKGPLPTKNTQSTTTQPNSTQSSAFNAGDKVSWTTKSGKPTTGTVVKPSETEGQTIVKGDKSGKEFAIKNSNLKGGLSEAKYIKDKRLITYLEKNLSVDKLKSFENLMNRIEFIRNKVKKLDAGGDKAIQNFVKAYQSNPILLTDFQNLFSVNSENPQAVNSLMGFINDVFVTLYSGKYKYDNMIDKIADIGGGINNLEEAKAKGVDPQDRRAFKSNLLKFLTTTIQLFQYLDKLKKEGKLNKTDAKKSVKKEEPKETQSESVNETNNLLTEQINRIKKIMYKID